MSESVTNVLDRLLSGEVWIFPILLLIIFTEFFMRAILDGYKSIDFREAASSIFMGLMYFFIGFNILHLFTPFVFEFGHENRITEMPNIWWAATLVIVVTEFIHYWSHRIMHHIRILWCIHMVHHSVKDMSVASAFRMGLLEVFFLPSILLIWLTPFLGFGFVEPLFMSGTLLIYGCFTHSGIFPKLGAVEKFLPIVTPSKHRVHHGRDPIYINKNYGGMLIVWDWVFGTFQEEIRKPDYGLTTQIDTYNPIRVQTLGFEALWKDVRSTDSWLEKLKYVFFRPGWKPEKNNKMGLSL
jgi:sterol desaturase/sphingolipid hydroxylase (fatty acid hydroxylase superfamily)